MWRKQSVTGVTRSPEVEPVLEVIDVEDIDVQVLRLFALVVERLEAATEAFLTGDRDTARALVASEPTVDAIQFDVEALAVRKLASGRPLAEEHVRLLILVLRIVPELERSADLVEHVALRTGQGLDRSISSTARQLVGEMGRVAVDMWRIAAAAYAGRDQAVAARLRRADDELDDLHVRLTAELGTEALPPSAAIEMGLIARFLERLGDHAVNVTRRLAHIESVPLAPQERSESAAATTPRSWS
jgi:phosphate transport system protein